MTTPDNMNPSGDAQDSTPTEALEATPIELADQGPSEAPAAAPATAPATAGKSHTRTILEVVGGVVAACLIIAAGIGGYAAGALSNDGGRGHGEGIERDFAAGGQMGGRDFGGQQMPGQMGGRDFGGQQMPGQQMPGQMGGQGFDMDGDGDFGGHHGMGHDMDGDGDFGGQQMPGQMDGQQLPGQMGGQATPAPSVQG